MQKSSPLLSLQRTRDQVRDVLRLMIAGGELGGGDRLEEVELSGRIGVSRTPLREALIALEEEGWVRSIPNKGFSVLAADESMVREIYPILGGLEAAAVRAGGPLLAAAIPELDATNKRLSTETRKPRQYELDSAFHSRLTRDCGNRRLLKLIKDHWAQARRFDGARARGTADRDGSCREHQGIIDAIRRGRTGAAADLLLEHWRRGEDTVTAWLRENS
jgi:DNA-binding GntR family transcriptional regulator